MTPSGPAKRPPVDGGANDETLVIAVLHNSSAYVDSLVEAIADWRFASRIILMDTSSADIEAVRAALDNAKFAHARTSGKLALVELGDNPGFGAAVNRCVDAYYEEEPWILVLNPDITVTQSCLEAMLEVLRSDSRAAAVGPTTFRADDNSALARRWTRLSNSLADVLPRALYGNRVGNPKWARLPSDGVVPWVEGSIILLRAGAYRAVGGFDEQFFLYSEDEDLCRTLWTYGWRIRQIDCGPDISHVRGASGGSNFPQVRAYYFASLYLFLRKWYGQPASYLFAAAFLITSAGRAVIRRPRDRPSVQHAVRVMRSGGPGPQPGGRM